MTQEFDPTKIIICIASGGSSSDTFNIYLQNCWAYSGFPKIIYEQSPYIHWNRESCAEYAIEHGYEYMMFFDNDMIFPLDIIKRLWGHLQGERGKDIVTCNYTTKERPARFMAIGFNGEAVETRADSTGLEKVWMAPTGVMLIRVEIFKKLSKPWFDTSRTHKLGEDYYFTNKCRYAGGVEDGKAVGEGVGVWIDHDLTKEIGHEGKYVYTYRDTVAGGCVDNYCNEKFPGGLTKKVVGTKV